MRLVECVPNFSEGRRPEVIAAIRDAVAAVPTVAVLDVSSDPSHNRTVLTFVVAIEQAVEAAFAGIRLARERIDLNQHRGAHPRMGAADVVPFIPLEGVTMEDCIGLARSLGERVGRELDIPVFLYERASTRPDRENLADVRRGEFEGLRDAIGRDPDRDPDFGPRRIHPTFGAVAIGARPFLVAFNVYLGPASNLSTAKEVAKAVRGSSGGLRYVKGLGLEVDGQAQVSMNLVDTDRTPVHRAFDVVKMESAARGVGVTWSEIVGLVPQQALDAAAVRHLQLEKFSPAQVLDRKVREAMSSAQSLSDFVASVASATPVPGGGSVAAHCGSLAAALAQMVARLTLGKKKYAAVEAEMRATELAASEVMTVLSSLVERDAAAYSAVAEAYRLPKEPEVAAAARRAAIAKALVFAAEVPLESARACLRVAELAALLAEKGNQNAVSDAGVAALLAEAACRAAAYNVRINIAALEDRSLGAPLVAEALRLVEETGRFAQRATGAVERAIG